VASLSLTVTGMTCDHCKSKVEKALKDVTGVYGAFVDLAEGMAEVDFDDQKVEPQALIDAVTASGYEARVAD
jgi:copper chaperone CopZ